VARRVSLADEAAESLATIEQWYRQPGAGQVASRRLRAIRAAIGRLVDFPYIGRPGDVLGTRELTCQDHRIVYLVAAGDGTSTGAGDIVVLDIFGPGEP